MKAENQKLKLFLSRLSKKTEKTTKIIDLDSLLISPVQRMPRYVLFLKDLMKFVNRKKEKYCPY